MMIRKVGIVLAVFVALLCSGCANGGDGGQILSGILTGIDAGLSGL